MIGFDYMSQQWQVMVTLRQFQSRVSGWMLVCFGTTVARNKTTRAYRFYEEATELVQACGMTKAECHEMVEYTYGRPVGVVNQEVGGVAVTLAALCYGYEVDLETEAVKELSRINTSEVIEKIRQKQATKPSRGPLPGVAS